MTIQSLQQSKSVLKDGSRTRRRERMAPLATLPVFYKLEGKNVLVAGGSDAAAWKAELLAASGAHVHIFAEELDPIFVELLNAPRTTGGFTHHAQPWSGSCFDGMQIAICDAETTGEAQAFYCTARAVGVAVNVIDKPKFCEFQFGSIVNRSPAVISISTDGAAPIFGQAIRRRIETLIAPPVAAWVELAQNIRSSINDRLSMGPERRAFWEAFVDAAFMREPQENEADRLIAKADKIAQLNGASKGKVTLVGAGPGDAELLTLKAVRALQAADVILFDDLVSSDVLELARREAKRMLVGKRGGRDSCKQDDINNMMVSLARSGKNVVRLKGGDPMIFGRAGEEITRLKNEGISVSVVPGITSASAMAAQLGVSLTHRDHAQSVRFVTGHSHQGELPENVDWAGIADEETTTIFYMGGRTAAQISARLIAEGLDPATPVIIHQSIGREDSKKWVGDLAALPEGMTQIGFENPVLIGIGNVFSALNQSTEIVEIPKQIAGVC